MAMHEFEDAAVDAVTLLDSSAAGSMDLRSMFQTLASFTNSWDAQFPHFHVLDPLLKHRYTYAIDVEQHPDYAKYREYFDGLTGYQNIYRDPGKEWDRQTNPEVAIFCHPSSAWPSNEPDPQKSPLYHALYNQRKIYCDAGSELWLRLIAAGVLSGADALPPDSIHLFDVIDRVVQVAETRGFLKQSASGTVSFL